MLTLMGLILRMIDCNILSSLKKLLGKTYSTYLELYAVLTEVESVVSFYPLTYLNGDQLLQSLNRFIYRRSLYSR